MYHRYYEEECTMYKYIINGGYKLHGETYVSGSKNAGRMTGPANSIVIGTTMPICHTGRRSLII